MKKYCIEEVRYGSKNQITWYRIYEPMVFLWIFNIKRYVKKGGLRGCNDLLFISSEEAREYIEQVLFTKEERSAKPVIKRKVGS